MNIKSVMANIKIRKKNTKYQSSKEDGKLVKGGNDVFFSAVIVIGSAIVAAVILLLGTIFN